MRTGMMARLAAGLILVAAAALASAEEHRGADAIKKAAAGAKISLAQAIETAQKEVTGGKVIEAGLETEKDATFYEVVVLSGDAVKEVKVDAASGKVLGVKDEKPDKDEEKELAEAKHALGAAKLTFAQALDAAAKEVKDGKAFKVELEMKGDQAVYEVVLLQGEKAMKVSLDAGSGKVAKVEEKKYGEKKEDETAEAKQALAAAKISPAQALEAAGKEVKDAQVLDLELEMENDTPTYSVALLQGDKVMEVKIDAVSGKAIKVEEEEQDKEEADELAESKAALATIKVPFAQALELAVEEVKDGKVLKAELEMEEGKVSYEVVLLQGEATWQVTLDVVSGKVLSSRKMERGHKESVEGGEWRQDFKVDKANWADHGTNPYFILEPGYRWHYKHGAATLTMTVLDETKAVDGVTTRIVEEREEKDGKPREVSRNYFAIDKSTNDVYYFGEDVDEYKDGKVAGHEGGWLAGAGGAKFGLMMPGKVKVGDKFYQEVAPKVAMDRAEIVSVDEKLETPAGKFEKCLRVKETTPREQGVSENLYAAGVGLVKDVEFVLESVDKPKK